jgi:hypothetical protein
VIDPPPENGIKCIVKDPLTGEEEEYNRRDLEHESGVRMQFKG